MKNKTADLLLLIVAIIWGGGFPAVDLALSGGMTPFYLIGMRFMIAFVMMGVVFFKQLKSIKKIEITGGLIAGLFLFVGFTLQTVGIMYTTASKNAFITTTYVVFVPLINYLIFKKKVNLNQVVGIGVMMIGLSILSLEADFSINIGDVLTLLSAFGFSGQIIATGYYMSKANAYCFNTVQMGTAGLLGMVVAICVEGLQPLSMQSGLSILYLGVFSTCAAFLLQSIAQKYTTETKVGLILSTEAVFGAILSVMILNEAITWRLAFGGVLMTLAMVLVESKPLRFQPLVSTFRFKKNEVCLEEESVL